MPIKREPEDAPLEQCPCIAVPTEPVPSGDLVSSSRASSDPAAQRVPSSTREKRQDRERKTREPHREMERGGAFLTQSKGQMAPWAFSNPQTLQLPLAVSDPPVQAEVAAHSHAQAHASPLAVVSQTKQQQETSVKFKREIAVTTAQHIHTCLPPLHTPFLPGREARQPQLNPVPRAVHGRHAARGRAERRSTAPVWPLARHPRAGDVQEELLRVPSPVRGQRVALICGCR